MNCLKCGYELKNEEKVCPMCGTEINNNEKERSNIEDEKRYQRKKYIIMISVITILLIINALFKEKENKHDNEFEKNVFNVWVTIDEDGSKGYLGSIGLLVKNKIKEIDGIKYYFDEKGIMVKNKEIEMDGIKYKADFDGKLSILDDYSVDKNFEKAIAKITSDGKIVEQKRNNN